MIRRRALAAGVATKVGNHSFRATGITAYLTTINAKAPILKLSVRIAVRAAIQVCEARASLTLVYDALAEQELADRGQAAFQKCRGGSAVVT